MIKELIKKYKQYILYLLFGGMTTLVNYVVYFLCKHIGFDYKLSTVFSWCCAVLFAFVTNKLFVFESKKKETKTVLKEIVMFFGGRIFSLSLELLIMKIGIDLLHADNLTFEAFGAVLPLGEFITKTVSQAVAVVTNFLLSKFLIFRKKKGGEKDEDTCD